MKIQLTKNISFANNGVLDAGSILEVEKFEGERLISRGLAELVVQTEIEYIKAETPSKRGRKKKV